MSKEQHSNSLCEDISSPDKSKGDISLDSSKESLTGIKTDSEIKDLIEDIESSVKAQAVKSVWDDSKTNSDDSQQECSDNSSSNKSSSNKSSSNKSSSDKKHKHEVIAKNIYGLNKVHAGPNFKKPLVNHYAFETNGNAFISGNLTVNGHVNQHDIYVESEHKKSTNYTVNNGDGINIIYTNSTRGPINITLGTPKNPSFEANRTIFIKDVTLEFAPASSYNVNITVPYVSKDTHYLQPRIEYYSNGALTVGTGTYAINTSGGAVSFRYFQPNIPGSHPTWVIDNQFSGNPRIPPHIGLTFIPADNKTKSDIINHY